MVAEICAQGEGDFQAVILSQRSYTQAGWDRRFLNRSLTTMLYTILVILLIFWLLGFSFHIAGGLIHLLLVVALIVFIIQMVTGRRAP